VCFPLVTYPLLRNKKVWSKAEPEFCSAWTKQHPNTFLLDGELLGILLGVERPKTRGQGKMFQFLISLLGKTGKIMNRAIQESCRIHA